MFLKTFTVLTILVALAASSPPFWKWSKDQGVERTTPKPATPKPATPKPATPKPATAHGLILDVAFDGRSIDQECRAQLQVTANTDNGEQVLWFDDKINFKDQTYLHMDYIHLSVEIDKTNHIYLDSVNRTTSVTVVWYPLQFNDGCKFLSENIRLSHVQLDIAETYNVVAFFMKHELDPDQDGGPFPLRIPPGAKLTIPRKPQPDVYHMNLELGHRTGKDGNCTAQLTIIGYRYEGEEKIFDQKVNMIDISTAYSGIRVGRLKDVGCISITWTPDQTNSDGCLAQATDTNIRSVSFVGEKEAALFEFKFPGESIVKFPPNTKITIWRY